MAPSSSGTPVCSATDVVEYMARSYCTLLVGATSMEGFCHVFTRLAASQPHPPSGYGGLVEDRGGGAELALIASLAPMPAVCQSSRCTSSNHDEDSRLPDRAT